jgi:hypothetical protein
MVNAEGPHKTNQPEAATADEEREISEDVFFLQL